MPRIRASSKCMRRGVRPRRLPKAWPRSRKSGPAIGAQARVDESRSAAPADAAKLPVERGVFPFHFFKRWRHRRCDAGGGLLAFFCKCRLLALIAGLSLGLGLDVAAILLHLRQGGKGDREHEENEKEF